MMTRFAVWFDESREVRIERLSKSGVTKSTAERTVREHDRRAWMESEEVNRPLFWVDLIETTA